MQGILGIMAISIQNDKNDAWCKLGHQAQKHIYVLNRQTWPGATKLDSPDRTSCHARSFHCNMTRAGVAILMVQTQRMKCILSAKGTW